MDWTNLQPNFISLGLQDERVWTTEAKVSPAAVGKIRISASPDKNLILSA